MKLKLADGLALPIETVTQKLAWLGVTGSGKTYGASKLAELFWHAGAQFVVLDPVGVWYGLRLAKNGKQPSAMTVPIFGGLHGDVPLEPTGGALLANLIVDKTLSAIIDVSQFESDAQKARFAHDLADRLFFRKKAAPSAMHLFLEECQEFVPQNPQRGEEQMLHVFIRMQKLGRNFGIGSSYISQRPQEVNKKALNMAQTLFVFRTTGTHERGAIEKWIQDKALDQDIAGDLPKIPTGDCHVWSPEFLKISETVHILEKETFNASATPEVGVTAKARELAPIDLDQVRADMAATIEKAKADDPRELRKQIADLKKELASKPAINFADEQQKLLTPKPVLTDADRALLEKLLAKIEAMAGSLATRPGAIFVDLEDRLRAAMLAAVTKVDEESVQARGAFLRAIESVGFQKILGKLAAAAPALTPIQPHSAHAASPRSSQPRRVPPALAPGTSSRPTRLVSANDEGALGKGERQILIAVAQHADGVTREQLSILTGYKRSSRDTYLQRLSGRGLVDVGGDRITATDAGLAALGDDYELLPTGDELQRYWLDRLTGGERELLAALIKAYPQAVDRESLSEATNYKRSSRDTYLQRLSARRLITTEGRGAVRASEELFS